MRDVSDAELDAALAAWHAHGFARIPAVAQPDELIRLRVAFAALVEAGSPDLFFQPDAPTGRYDDVAFGDGYAGPDVNYRKIEKLERDPTFFAWLTAPLFARIAARVHPEGTSLYRATLFHKAAKLGSDLPFHQDGGKFWGLDRDPCLQAWTALDDATEAAGCLAFVPGSHRAGLATPLGGVVPAPLTAGVIDELVPAPAGDVLLIHNLVWHRSGANRTSSPRRAFSVSYLSALTRCTRKKHAPRQFLRLF